MLTNYTIVKDISSEVLTALFEGGPGSGHWGHSGRPGYVGGSLPGGVLPDGIVAGTKEGKEWVKANQDRYNSDREFRILVDTVTLFTQGVYDKLRAASRYADEGEEGVKAEGFIDTEWLDDKLGSAAFPLLKIKNFFEGQDAKNSDVCSIKEAGRVLNEAVDNSPKREILYRGVSGFLGRKTIDSVIALKEGDVFSIVGVSSFTDNRDVGEMFMRGKVPGIKKPSKPPPIQILFIAKGAPGLSVSALSPYKQSEFLSRGTFKVVGKREKVVRVSRGSYREITVEMEYIGKVSEG